MSGFKTFVIGALLTAADLNAYMVQHDFVIKPSDETRSNNSSIANDSHLSVSVAANTKYYVDCLFHFTAANAGDIGFGFAGPSGATFRWTAHGLDINANVNPGSTYAYSSPIGNTQAASAGGDAAGVHVRGVLRVGGTAGTFSFQWAQASSNASGTTVLADSIMRLQRLS